MDQHSQRLYEANDSERFDITEDNVRRSRQAYFANISYLDDKIGGILERSKPPGWPTTRSSCFCSDHGDMLGERGMWFKMSFFEGSARVPLMIAGSRRKRPDHCRAHLQPRHHADAGCACRRIA
jgi:choline-sulfatase